MEILFLLLAAHALGDFAFQGDWMSINKNRNSPVLPSSSKRPDLIWLHVLSAHCFIHGGMVLLITGNVWLGIAEFICHWVLDFCKNEKWIGFHTDQLMHIACKFVWAAIVIYS